ncbi:MAG: M48 family metallopeptidase [Kiritimatiellae bacterium]|nr:M48 family metallopeptidase [Kiritimatiellia bacterium]
MSTMDFFKSQDAARKKSSILVVYYCLAVIMIVLAVYVAAMVLFQGAMAQSGHKMAVKTLWNTELFVWITGITSAIVLIGTIYKISQLSSGGAAVAEMLGGVEIETNTRDLDQRKILNVVEEISIASGVPVPRVFLLEGEEGINAFAAGFSPSDAVIGVTSGCIGQLNRDELQGVIAHEFSHILNGDMKLNIRLLGVLNGILVIGLIGYWIFRSTSRTRSKKGNALPVILFGLIVWAIGYIGVFFGKLIKSAVSRQREYLADASAVQFTRNPAGIAGALKKIGGFTSGSKIQNDHAEEASHFFFCNGLAESFSNLMATHPPLEDRIKRLDPYFEMERAGQLDVLEITPPQLPDDNMAAGVSRFAVNSANVIASVGVPTSDHVKYASKLVSNMPVEVVNAVHETSGAGAVVYALLMNSEEQSRNLQLKYLADNVEGNVYNHVLQLIPVVAKMGDEAKLPLVDMAIPALKRLTHSQYLIFRKHVDGLVLADKEVDLFEYTLQRILMRHLASSFGRISSPSIRYYDVNSVLPICGKLLSCLAYWGADDAETAKKAFEAGARKLVSGNVLAMSPVDNCGLPMLNENLNQVVAASPMVKKQVLDACVTCIGADGYVTLEEAELIRAIADSMDCPLPPFLPGIVNGQP